MATTHSPATGRDIRRFRRPVTAADIILAARLRAGDRDAFTDLYQSAAVDLTRFVAARVWRRDRDLIEDFVQEAYCLALTEPHRIDPDLRGSMRRLAVRAMTNHSWSQRRYLRAARTIYTDRTVTSPGTAVGARPGPVAGRTIAAVTLTRFPQALARLTPDQRRAVQLRYLDGQPRTTVAAQMGRTIDAMRWLEGRALRRLHELCTA
ncbi:sigma-70 family RNA polymerase sigma factor [Dactylosporangium sp. NBC_01737]|uniref:RNA polymerase sigma factor n=1 Tax=Dactylosporangium sp. NBC_01737 TaxID=2975959 RepID=UPI002E0DEAF2|nr:sigma-70 family RNA polymerase sigma factor [Dactylosporangium sp. NBC_01737]